MAAQAPLHLSWPRLMMLANRYNHTFYSFVFGVGRVAIHFCSALMPHEQVDLDILA